MYRSSWSLGRVLDGFRSKLSRKKRKGVNTQNRRRIAIEHLEDRTLLSISTWTGGGDLNWMTPGNWDVRPSVGSDLVFSGTASLSPTNNDFPAGMSFNSIKLSADDFQLSGNSLTLEDGIIVDSGVTGSVIALDIALGNAMTVDVADDDMELTISGVLSGSNYLKKTGEGKIGRAHV